MRQLLDRYKTIEFSCSQLIVFLFLFALLLPVPAGDAWGEDLCADYTSRVENALDECDFEALLKMQTLLGAPAGQDCPSAEKSLAEAKCQYFFACAVPALNRAYMNCDLPAVLRLEKSLLDNLGQCTDYVNMREKILGMKCLYFDSCLRKDLEAAQQSCDWETIMDIEEFMASDVLKSCPDYDRMRSVLREYRCNSFNLCMLDDLKVARQDCNLGKIRQIDRTLQTKLDDCANYAWMQRQLDQVKCDYGLECASELAREFAPSECRPNKLARLQEQLSLQSWRGCSPYQYRAMQDLRRRLQCEYLQNCAGPEFERQADECDLEGLPRLEQALDACRGTVDALAERIKDKKAAVVGKCIQKRLDRAVADCDLPAIRNWREAFPAAIAGDYPTEEVIREMVQASEERYLRHCLEPQLQAGVSNCSLGQIQEVARKVRRELKGSDSRERMLLKVRESECMYFADCTQRRLDEAVENCDYEEISRIKRLSRKEEVKHCPGYERVEAGIPEALGFYFDSCAQKRLYEAYDKCDWDGILAVEEMVENDLKFSRDYRKKRVVVLEVKCSYFMSCLNGRLQQARAAADMAELRELKQLIERELSSCPNYPTLSRIIREAIANIH